MKQGDGNAGHDDWWRDLYDESAEDTGEASSGDTLDDRFASAAGTLRPGRTPGPDSAPGTGDEPAEPPAGSTWDRPPEEESGSRAPVPGPRADPDEALLEPDTELLLPGPGAPPADPREASAAPSVPGGPPRTATGPSAPAAAAPARRPPRPRAPWEPPAAQPSQPRTFASRPAAAPQETADAPAPAAGPPPRVRYVGEDPPGYEAEPTALPAADPEALEELVADTVLDGARYGSCTLRAVSVRGDAARHLGEPRRDSLLTARFGEGEDALVLLATATGARGAAGGHRAAAEACAWLGEAVGRSHARLAEDIRAGRRADLKSGLQRLTDRSLGKLRARAHQQGADPAGYTAVLRCLLLPADPRCRSRVFFGVGDGGLLRLREGRWEDIEPSTAGETADAGPGTGSGPDTLRLGVTAPPSPYVPARERARDPFRFQVSVGRPGDVLLLCGPGLAAPLRGEPALLAHLADRWRGQDPPGLADFLADTQVGVRGYADDRTAAAVWEA
ncbi:protein phosphatase 2C domain-containing protein [Streptomyces sp. SCSIO ZS0520]|uniref:protein phosphatase 2C domain-containing protein n=1 Tax=Streptomyces sp. SCSIO ZS0520 TaxID=2892996 RepID=UPI0021DA4E5F|nr:protein phosphatase 2C domain-containing protein [Streptomyces sp. SCSIO ZS0520]